MNERGRGVRERGGNQEEGVKECVGEVRSDRVGKEEIGSERMGRRKGGRMNGECV